MFPTLPIKGIWGSVTYKKLPGGKLLKVQSSKGESTKKFFLKFEIITIKNTRVMDYIRKINSAAAFPGGRAEHVHEIACSRAEYFFFFQTKLSPTEYCLIALIFSTKLLETSRNKIALSLFL